MIINPRMLKRPATKKDLAEALDLMEAFASEARKKNLPHYDYTVTLVRLADMVMRKHGIRSATENAEKGAQNES